MSILAMIDRIEKERSLHNTLLNSLLDAIDADIQRLTERKVDLLEEFAERDASLSRLIDGDMPKANVPAITPETEAVNDIAA